MRTTIARPAHFDVIDQDGERQIGNVLSPVDEDENEVHNTWEAVAFLGIVTLGTRAGYLIKVPLDEADDWTQHTVH